MNLQDERHSQSEAGGRSTGDSQDVDREEGLENGDNPEINLLYIEGDHLQEETHPNINNPQQEDVLHLNQRESEEASQIQDTNR
jgi:hypothetical protein